MNVKINEPEQIGKDLEEKVRHEEITERLLPGQQYTDWLKWFHQTLHPANYLEIGVNTGRSLQYVNEHTLTIGVDPNPVIEYPLTANTKIFSQTSNDFFSDNDVWSLLNNKPIELAFIDGLHHYDQVLRDFMNVEKYSSSSTVAVFHDIYPVVPETATREWNTFYWAGDTWKFMHILKKYRPDLSICTIPTFPTGLGLVTNLDSSSTIFHDHYASIVKEFLPLVYELNNPVNKINNDFNEITQLLKGI